MTRNETSMKVEEALFGVDAVAEALIDRLTRSKSRAPCTTSRCVNLLQNEVKRALKLLDGADDDEGTSTHPPTSRAVRAEADAPETEAPGESAATAHP